MQSNYINPALHFTAPGGHGGHETSIHLRLLNTLFIHFEYLEAEEEEERYIEKGVKVT